MSVADLATHLFQARRDAIQTQIAIVRAKLLGLAETESEIREEYQNELDKLQALQIQAEAVYRNLLSNYAEKQ